MNKELKTNLNNLENSKAHDIWKTIGFSVANVGLFTLTWFAPVLAPITVTIGVGSGIAAFGCGMSIKYDNDSI